MCVCVHVLGSPVCTWLVLRLRYIPATVCLFARPYLSHTSGHVNAISTVEAIESLQVH